MRIHRSVFGTALTLALGCGAVPALAEEPPKDEPGAEAKEKPAAPPPAAPQAAKPKPKAKPPGKYEILRFREDWRPLLDTPVCVRCDLSDRLKARRLGGCLWADFGGQVRFRYEHFENFNFGALGANSDDGWLLTRVRAHADFHLDPHLRAYVEGIWADQEEREAGPRPIDENHGDLLNAFGEVHSAPGRGWNFGLRAGREELLFGKQRVVGPLDWGNTRRAFDGVHGWVDNSCWRLDGWYSRLVVVEAEESDEWWRDGVELAGVYGKWKGWKEGTVEPYAIYLHRDSAGFAGVTGTEDRGTVGLLVAGPLGRTRFDFDFEGAYQFGELGDREINAASVTGELGWKPCGWRFDPRFAIGADWASGDDGGEGDLNTYNQLYPTGHLWFGWADLIGRQNLVAGRLTATAQLTKTVFVRADLHAFFRASTEDAVYNAAGAVLRAPLGSDERHVGEEVDFLVRWSPNRHLDVEAGYCHFFAGEFLSDTGASDDVDFLYTSLTFTF